MSFEPFDGYTVSRENFGDPHQLSLPVAMDALNAPINESIPHSSSWYSSCLFSTQGGQAAMMNFVKQMGGTLNLNDLLLIMSIALSIPLRLAFPLVVEIVRRRIDIRLTFGDQDAGNSSTRPMPILS
jgi:hypothetical protein